ncbi:MAG: helix-turn-helix domain-containing protein [Oscillospiraceae bacterium]|nr:helix-turn-helix domain-containing protein [Oscillospiraceae bacterium]
MHHIQSESLDQLFDAILNLKTREECSKFFADICTVKELLDLAQRMDVAVLLDQGVSYQAIAQQINVSTATISRVSRCLNYGSGGYRLVLDRLQEDKK